MITQMKFISTFVLRRKVREERKREQNEPEEREIGGISLVLRLAQTLPHMIMKERGYVL